MALRTVFNVATDESAPLDASGGAAAKQTVSGFITTQSFTNFAVMTGAITMAWNAIRTLIPAASGLWIPYLLALGWAAAAVVTSLEGLKKKGKLVASTLTVAIFTAIINSLVLAGAVVGTAAATHSLEAPQAVHRSVHHRR